MFAFKIKAFELVDISLQSNVPEFVIAATANVCFTHDKFYFKIYNLLINTPLSYINAFICLTISYQRLARRWS